MRKFLLILFIFLLFGCESNYKRNIQINKRTPPIVIIGIDTSIASITFKDGDEKVFTLYNSPTTKALIESRSLYDTIRVDKTIVNF